jgi:hypothetical protein
MADPLCRGLKDPHRCKLLSRPRRCNGGPIESWLATNTQVESGAFFNTRRWGTFGAGTYKAPAPMSLSSPRRAIVAMKSC